MADQIEKASEKGALAEAGPIPLATDNHMVVLAKDPQQMQASQQQLIAWFQERLASTQHELAEAEANLEQAKQRKWATTGWKRQVNLARGRVVFNEKAIAALEAGYCIVPDFPTEVFAIRTSRAKPTRNARTTPWGRPPNPQQADLSPLGEGEYKSPHTFNMEDRQETEETLASGGTRKKTEVTVWADSYDVPDFPLKTVTPHILDATGKAMALKIFDEMGVLPARRQRARGGDPIVTGRISRREGTRDIGLTFLIAWWIDTRDL